MFEFCWRPLGETNQEDVMEELTFYPMSALLRSSVVQTTHVCRPEGGLCVTEAIVHLKD